MTHEVIITETEAQELNAWASERRLPIRFRHRRTKYDPFAIIMVNPQYQWAIFKVLDLRLNTIHNYANAHADQQRLVREMDHLINGAAAAPQASLCDIVAQLRDILK